MNINHLYQLQLRHMMEKRNALLLVALMVLAVAMPSNATSQMTVYGDGDEFSNTSPINLVYMDEVGTRCQVIYPASALYVMRGETINSMTFYIADEGITIDGGSVRVSVAETEQTEFTNGYIDDGLVQVATISFTSGVNQLVINFDEPFLYHGGNLLLDTYVEEAAIDCYNLFVGYRPTTYTSFTRGEVSKFLPKTTFNYGTDAEFAAKVLPTEVTFNTIRAEREDVKTVTLKNIGQSPFTPSFEATAPFSVTLSDVELAPGKNLTIPITFSPMAEGVYDGTLNIDCGPAGVLTVALHGTAMHAATDMTVCDSTDYASFVPIYGLDIDVVSTEGQMIYPAEMLSEMVGSEIHSLRFHTYKNVEMNGGVIQLSFKVVDGIAFEQEAMTTDLTAVATVSPVYGSTDLVFDLDEPFEYNGGNLLVACKVIEAGTTNYRQTFFFGTPMDYNCGIYRSVWYGDVFDIAYVPFLPMATFSYVKEGTGPEVLRGDVNLDGTVNIADVAALIDILLTSAPAPAEADCNLDGAVNISDVTTMIDYLLVGNW